MIDHMSNAESPRHMGDTILPHTPPPCIITPKEFASHVARYAVDNYRLTQDQECEFYFWILRDLDPTEADMVRLSAPEVYSLYTRK